MVLSRAQNGDRGGTRWLCRCDCGTERVVPGVTLRGDRTHSCGCLKSEQNVARSTKHGHSNTRETSSTYYSWAAMLQRCGNKKHKDYPRYGGRGIRVCERWLKFVNFLADMGEKPVGHTIERKDNDGDYEPGNCRWATSVAQANNKSNNRVLQYDGERRTLSQWARKLRISPSSLADRLKQGSLSDALSRERDCNQTRVTLRGKTQALQRWLKGLRLSESTYHYRIRSGMTPAEALLKPTSR